MDVGTLLHAATTVDVYVEKENNNVYNDYAFSITANGIKFLPEMLVGANVTRMRGISEDAIAVTIQYNLEDIK